MKRNLLIASLTLLMPALLACSVIDSVVNQAVGKAVGGSDNLTVISQLWPDVPRMDGLTPSQMDLPLPVKLLMRAVLGNLGRLNKPGENQTTGNIDWIVFTTAKTSDDVKNFYTNARMTAQGWQASQNSTCVSGSAQGVAQVGVFCAFRRRSGSQESDLLIVAASDDQTKQTDVFFLRLDYAATPTPN